MTHFIRAWVWFIIPLPGRIRRVGGSHSHLSVTLAKPDGKSLVCCVVETSHGNPRHLPWHSLNSHRHSFIAFTIRIKPIKKSWGANQKSYLWTYIRKIYDSVFGNQIRWHISLGLGFGSLFRSWGKSWELGGSHSYLAFTLVKPDGKSLVCCAVKVKKWIRT